MLSFKNNKYNTVSNKNLVIIKNTIRKTGIPINLLGYRYIIEALTYMLNFKSFIFIKDIYIKISNNNCTSKNCVEASIRNAIKKAIKFDNFKIRKTLHISKSVKISNTIFLNSILEIIIEKIAKF